MYYSTYDGFHSDCCYQPNESVDKKWIVKREQINAKALIKPLNHDFLEDLPGYIRDIMYLIENNWKSKDWFEEAWNKYRDHVLSGDKIKAPGFVFNDYIDKQIEEDFLNYEQNQMLHSDKDINTLCHSIFANTRLSELSNDYIEHKGGGGNPYHDPNTGRFISAVGASTKATEEISRYAQQLPTKKGKNVYKEHPEMSSKDMQEAVNRMQLEQRYSDLKGETKYVKTGGEKAKETLSIIGSVVGIAGSLAIIGALVRDAFKKKKGGS